MLVRTPMVSRSAILMMMRNTAGPQRSESRSRITAAHVAGQVALNASHPASQWERAEPICFSCDWQGKNADPKLQTEVRLLWSPQALYLRFVCHYRELWVFDDSDPNGRRDELWDRDVAEAFLQPDPSRPAFYREFEVSPNGMWVDLDIFPGGRSDLKSGMRRSVSLDKQQHTWAAELEIPVRSLTPNFDPARIWRANFYRVEGSKEPRTYLAWQPTNTPQPNFHVPDAFGELQFAPGG